MDYKKTFMWLAERQRSDFRIFNWFRSQQTKDVSETVFAAVTKDTSPLAVHCIRSKTYTLPFAGRRTLLIPSIYNGWIYGEDINHILANDISRKH
ncbi:hypothetical protein [Paenibacillus sp. NPDC057934]|uniref:hypothetical protein n=1 Tax=Paenibacillus sp. NPDC057934 TaxID=3346282 RepID=UPI0036DA271C